MHHNRRPPPKKIQKTATVNITEGTVIDFKKHRSNSRPHLNRFSLAKNVLQLRPESYSF